ncbi:hypothetical protein GN956_G7257 [Arapaima gigas]
MTSNNFGQFDGARRWVRLSSLRLRSVSSYTEERPLGAVAAEDPRAELRARRGKTWATVWAEDLQSFVSTQLP